jgi:hypothetical protein
MSDTYIAPEDVREHARRSALAGRPIYVNPHLGGEAELWFIAYRAVPDDQRGSQPELLTSFRTIHARAKKTAHHRPFVVPVSRRARSLHYER